MITRREFGKLALASLVVPDPLSASGLDSRVAGVRVGVHTGEVLLGGGVDAEGSIRGQAVNIAARMEQTAPSGGLRISHDTYRHVRGVFTVETQPPLTVKGVDQPIVSQQLAVLRAKNIVEARKSGTAVRYTVRDTTLRALLEVARRIFDNHLIGTQAMLRDLRREGRHR